MLDKVFREDGICFSGWTYTYAGTMWVILLLYIYYFYYRENGLTV